MKTKRNKKQQYPKDIDLILTSDWHLMEKQPKCREDNFWETQWNKIKQIGKLSNKYKIPMYHSGDLLDYWRSSPYLLNKIIKEFKIFKYGFYSIIGNHDQPSHNLEQMNRSGLQTLFDCHVINKLQDQMDWGVDLKECKNKYIYYSHNKEKEKRSIVFAHIMTYKGKKPWPNCTDPECNELFDMFPDTDLIVTGHNHKTFTARKGNQLLVNPGSLTRHKADQIDHKPCVFLYSAKYHKLHKHYLDIKQNVISREHIETKNRKDKRITAFIEKLAQGWDLDLSFDQNMEKVLSTEKIKKKIKNIIYEWMENG